MSKNDSKNDTLRNMLLAVTVFLTVMIIGPQLLPTPKAPTAQPGAATAPGEHPGAVQPGTTSTAQGSTSPGAGPPGTGQAAVDRFSADQADAETTVTIGSALPTEPPTPDPFRMRLTLSNIGASVESATMTDHAALLRKPERYTLLHPVEREGGPTFRSLPIEKINIDGQDLSLAGAKWRLKTWSEGGDTRGWTETTEGQAVEFFVEISDNGQPALRLTRRFMLPRQTIESGRHDLRADLTIENLTTERAYKVVSTYGGGLGIPAMDTRMDDRVVDWGLQDAHETVAGNRVAYAKVAGALPEDYVIAGASDTSQVVAWAATGNKYFSCTLAPLASRAEAKTGGVSSASGVDLDRDSLTNDDVNVMLVTPRTEVAPTTSVAFPVDVYIGEKSSHQFRVIPEYSARNYYYQVAQGYGMCTFSWLVELMVWLLNSVHTLVSDFGIAIIGLVLVVRTILHPITKKGQVNMVKMQQRMGELAPRLEEMKKKYANDKARLQQETMKIYQEQGVNPATQVFTCIPMFIQMPIWIALYISLNNNILMRHEPLFWGITWIDDLTAPDALYTFAAPIVVPLAGWSLPHFNLLPILVAITMYTQQKLQPKPKVKPNASAQQQQQQEMMQKMMPMMSIMMLLFFYKMPSGLNLYIMASSFFGTIEQMRIRKHIKDHEEAGTLHQKKAPADPKKRGKLSFFQKLQAMAEDAQKKAQHRSNPKR